MILYTEELKIEVHIIDVQMQAGGSKRTLGGSDSILFVIAFATAIANGVSPGKFIFNQTKMRQHLYECFVSGDLQMFPTLRDRRGTNCIKTKDGIEIFWACRMPDLAIWHQDGGVLPVQRSGIMSPVFKYDRQH